MNDAFMTVVWFLFAIIEALAEALSRVVTVLFLFAIVAVLLQFCVLLPLAIVGFVVDFFTGQDEKEQNQ